MSKPNAFCTWLETFLDEKGIDLDESFDVKGPVYGANTMTLQHVVDTMMMVSTEEQSALKAMFVKLDYLNKPIVPYIKHLAQAIAL